MKTSLSTILLATAMAATGTAVADDPPPAVKDSPMANLPSRTLGGRQFWGDVAFFRGWRIQHNVFSGHYRLLDSADLRAAWGTLAECRTALDEIKRRDRLAPMQGKAVLVVHGIIRSSKSFATMSRALEQAGYTVVPFDYPSTRVTIPESAEYLRQVIESLDGIEEVNFVVHSMGGLVVRAYLKEHDDPRIGRMVMLGVPNLGARMANLLQQNLLFKAVFGPAGQQLIDDPEGLIAALPTPRFEFAVIAGARGTPQGFNPLIPGDDDGTVSVEATRLPGAADFMTVNSLHSFMMGNAEVIAASVRFLQTGRLRSQGDPQPIPAPLRPD